MMSLTEQENQEEIPTLEITQVENDSQIIGNQKNEDQQRLQDNQSSPEANQQSHGYTLRKRNQRNYNQMAYMSDIYGQRGQQESTASATHTQRKNRKLDPVLTPQQQKSDQTRQDRKSSNVPAKSQQSSPRDESQKKVKQNQRKRAQKQQSKICQRAANQSEDNLKNNDQQLRNQRKQNLTKKKASFFDKIVQMAHKSSKIQEQKTKRRTNTQLTTNVHTGTQSRMETLVASQSSERKKSRSAFKFNNTGSQLMHGIDKFQMHSRSNIKSPDYVFDKNAKPLINTTQLSQSTNFANTVQEFFQMQKQGLDVNPIQLEEEFNQVLQNVQIQTQKQPEKVVTFTMGPINTLQTVNEKINRAKMMRKKVDLSLRYQKRGESNSVAKKLFHYEEESSINQSQVEEPISAEDDEESQPNDEQIPQIDVRFYDDSKESSSQPQTQEQHQIQQNAEEEIISVQQLLGDDNIEKTILEIEAPKSQQQERQDEVAAHRLEHQVEQQQEAQNRVEVEPIIKCTCSKTGCNKAYCICFRNGKSCDPKVCQCTTCKNCPPELDQALPSSADYHNESQEFQQKQADYLNTLRRRKEYIEIREAASSCCNCTRNSCQKNYCRCYKEGNQCGDQCNCHNCHNKEQKIEDLVQNDDIELD